MSYEQRDYARGVNYARGGYQAALGGSLGGGGRLSVVGWLLIANVVAFLVTLMDQRLMYGLFAMVPRAVWHGEIWRLFTAMFLHVNFGHILFNMLGLWFFGPPVERAWGGRKFFIVYTLGGITGNLLLTLAGATTFILPQTIGVGASGGVLTVLGAAAVLFPRTTVLVYFLFPVNIRVLIAIFTVLYVGNVLAQGANYGGDISHLAGVAVGIAFANATRYGKRIPLIDRGATVRRARPVSPGPPRPDSRSGWRPTRPDQETLDRLLHKVRTEGIHSLSERERRQLENIRRQMT